MSTIKNKTIAKNTMLLYFRMIISMLVTLYTSRVILNTLGVEDFGIYNVVGGVVMMLSFLNSAMASSTQRYLTFNLGKNDNTTMLNKVFSMSINIHAVIALVILILAETIGLWFLNTKLIISPERMIASNWVYQLSILTFIVTIMSVPYNAVIIAYERMNIFAYVGIFEVVLKLLIVFMLNFFGFDKLILYAILVFVVSLLIRIIYGVYCKRQFSECTYHFISDKVMFKEMSNFAGWSLFGNIAAVSYNQGINILLNIFFGTVVNAARAIAIQVNAAINNFVYNFQMALNPQITKSFSTGDFTYMNKLIFQGGKLSFFLLLLLSLPVMIETHTILSWWLKIVPEHTVIFCRLILVSSLIETLSGPLITAAQATGRIKKYQAVVGGLLLLNLPVSYLLLKMGYNSEVTLYVAIFFSIIALLLRIQMLRSMIQLPAKKYFKSVIFKILIVTFVASIIPLFSGLYISDLLLRFFTVCVSSFVMTLTAVYFLGIDKEERLIVKHKIVKIFQK